MKPRTKLQMEVWKLHQKLSTPRDQEQFVISNHKFYCTKHYKNLICLECNHQWRPSANINKSKSIKCPKCNKKLKLIETNNGGIADRIITYSVIEVIERFQVVRYFSCWKYMSKKNLPKYSFYSLFEEWKDWEKNKTVIIGRTQSWYGDGFSNSEYEIRDYGQNSWRSPYKTFASEINCPGAEFLPRFKKYGLTKFKHNCDFRLLIEKLEMSPKIETLLKAGQKDLLEFAVHKDSRYNIYWAQIKIVIRNNYKIKDVGLWYDYLDLLKYFNKDINNPKFILPKNLKVAHNEYVEKKQKKEEKERAERELRRQENERLKAEAEEALKGIKYEIFKDFSFKRGDIKVVCLVDEKDVENEGKVLKHCVYANEYHKKSGILLMSARINDKPIETIEISLANYSIIQCRGYDNNPTEYHNEIISIVRSNMHKISRIVEKQKKLKELDSNLKKLEELAA